MVVIPNSVISKSIVTNHSRPTGSHRYVIKLNVDIGVAPSRVIDALQAAGAGSLDLCHGIRVQAYACAFSDSMIAYELAFSVDSFALIHGARSAMLVRIADAFRASAIPIGAPPMDVKILHEASSVGLSEPIARHESG
jgi:small-conductance mechanosensitive channel